MVGRDEINFYEMSTDELLSAWFAAWVVHDDMLAQGLLVILNMRAPWSEWDKQEALPVEDCRVVKVRSIMHEYYRRNQQR